MGQLMGVQFLGYPFLAEIAQNGLVKACVSSVADDMIRNWIQIVRTGQE